MFSYPSEIRRAVYTTNTIESLNAALRKVSKNKALFPNDEAVFKLKYLALSNISKKWTMPTPNWSAAPNQFAILFEGRVPMGGLSQTHLHRLLRTTRISLILNLSDLGFTPQIQIRTR